MTLEGQKLAVLVQLQQEKNPVSLKELIDKLGDEFKPRTVRRWLAEMAEEGLVQTLGKRKATKYQAFQNQESENQRFRPKSLSAIAWVQKPIYERPPVAYIDEWLKAYIPNHTFYLPSPLRKQLYQEGQRSQKHDPAGTYAHQIFNRLLIDLSYNSSRLEGNTYSLLDTQRLLLEGKGAEGKLDEEKIMILNHKEAIRYLVDQAASIEPSIKTLCTLHYLLAEGLVESKYAGKIRDHGVRIGGSTYIPYENPKQLELQFKQIATKAHLIENPFEQSFFLLVHLTYLQPFIDVNKRTARLAANIPLIKQNLVPLSFNDVEREDYTSAVLAIYELQNIYPLLDLYTFSYLRTCKLYDSTIKALGFDEIRVRYRSQRRAIVRTIILQQLHKKAIQKYIQEQAKAIPQEDRNAFLEDLEEDLAQIDESRLAGLGVTTPELHAWLANR